MIDVDGKEKKWPLPEPALPAFYPNSTGFRYEADAVRRTIRAGKIECETVSHSDSLTIANIQDEIRRQIGVTYPADLE